MDFERIIGNLAEYFEEHDASYALIGGLALATYGVVRATVDLDIVVDAEIQEDLIQHMNELGYETLYRSGGYSNHRHPDPDWGRVDIVYVRDRTSRDLFSSVVTVAGFGDLRVPVPRVEHLIAMKVLAMKNDPSRTFQEMADIRSLLEHSVVDREEVRGYFLRHGLLERFSEIENSL